MKLYKMQEKYIKQPWFEQNSIYKLIEVLHDRKIRQFGVDCIWENIHTGVRINNWDNTMEELSLDESRNIKLNIIL